MMETPNTEDLARRVAMRDLRLRAAPADSAPRYLAPCPIDFGPGIQRMERRCRVRQRIGELKDRVRALGVLQQLRLERAHYQATGFTWRGWWYPAWLVGLAMGVAILAALAAFGLLAWGLFRHPILGA